MLDVVVESGNPADSERCLPMLRRHVETYGEPPQRVAFDRGYASRANLVDAKKLGVEHVMFHKVCNLVIGWPEVGWKMTRPATSDTVQGTFGLRLDPIPTMAHGDRYTTLVFRDQSQLTAAAVGELDALIVLGGHSADVLRVDPAVTGFVADAWQRGVLVGALECGQMVLMSAGMIDGQRGSPATVSCARSCPASTRSWMHRWWSTAT